MTKGFFSIHKVQSRRKVGDIPHCGACGLYKHCEHPKMPPTGTGKKKILVVAEAPGEYEDRDNIQLHKKGKSGKYTRRTLKGFDIELDRDCIKTNAVICRREGNKKPEDYMIDACRPNLMKTIEKHRPKVILLLGEVACKSLLKEAYRDDVGSISRWSGYCIPCREPNAWIVPTYHPSYVLRGYRKGHKPGSDKNNLLEVIFERDVEQAIDKAREGNRPKVVNYREQVEIITRPSQAAKAIKGMMKEEKRLKKKGAIAFDYEANCLKPEGEGTELVSCSICWRGRKTISYPWQGEAVEATNELLKSPIPKIAANLKFEDRWTRVKLGHAVSNWYWDVVVGAHILNNAKGVTSLGFQAFVHLGQENYGAHIKPCLKPKKGNRFNRIYELDLNDLLLYGGLDSYLTYWVAMKQIRLMG